MARDFIFGFMGGLVLAVLVAFALPVQAGQTPAPAPDCVPQSVLSWVDHRETVAISPTRWQNVRKTLLGWDDGMSLADMEVIYNRRVRNGWEAGHWVPIIAAVKCLQAPPPVPVNTESAQDDGQPQPLTATQEPADDPPQTADVMPTQDDSQQPPTPTQAEEPAADLSQPPATFVYFDDKDEMESGGESWSRYGRRLHHEWIRPDGATANQAVQAWNKWGPWDDLSVEVRQSIHDSVGLDHVALTSGCGGFNATGLACTPLGENLQQHSLDLNKWTWRGDFVEYTIHPVMKDHWEVGDTAPQMVFKYDPDQSHYSRWNVYVEYTRNNGLKFSADQWYGVSFVDGAVRDRNARDGPGNDGLVAQFYRKNDYFQGYPDNLPANSFLVGEVRRPNIIGTFMTGTGQ